MLRLCFVVVLVIADSGLAFGKDQNRDQDALCPCMKKEHCPRIYGKSAMDIREMGFLPPCQDFGTVRCCGVSIRIEQDTDRQKVDWANFDIKSKNKGNNVLQREDLLSAPSDQSVQTLGGPRRTIVKLRRRKIGSKEPVPDSEVGKSEGPITEPETNVELKTSPIKKLPLNKSILKLRRPGQRPESSDPDSSSLTVSTSQRNFGNQHQSSSTSDDSLVIDSEAANGSLRPKPLGGLLGRKKASSSFTASVSKTPDLPTEQTLEIQEKFNSPPSPTATPNLIKYIPKIRPFTSKPSTSGQEGTESQYPTGHSINSNNPSPNVDSYSIRPRLRRPVRPRKPVASPPPELNKNENVVVDVVSISAENSVNQVTSGRVKSTSIGSSDNTFISVPSSPAPEPELLTTKRPKYIRKRIRTTQAPPSSPEIPTTTDNLANVADESDYISTAFPPFPTTTTTRTELPVTTTLEDHSPQVSSTHSIPTNKPVSTQVSFSISSVAATKMEPPKPTEEILILPLRPTTTPFPAPPTQESVLIYSAPPRGGNHYNSQHHSSRYDVAPYKEPKSKVTATQYVTPVADGEHEYRTVTPSVSGRTSHRRFSAPSHFKFPTQEEESHDHEVIFNGNDSPFESHTEGGSDSYDLVLDKETRGGSQPSFVQRQDGRLSSGSMNNAHLQFPVSTASHLNYPENHSSQEQEETRVHLEVAPSQSINEGGGIGLNLPSLTTGRRRGRPATRKELLVTQQPPSASVEVVQVKIENPDSTAVTPGKRPAGYRRIRVKPQLLTATEDGGKMNSFEVTEIMSPSSPRTKDYEPTEASTTKFVFPPYRFQISGSPAAEEAASYPERGIGPLDVLRTPLLKTTNQETSTEEAYTHQIPPTERPAPIRRPTTPITPKPQRKYPQFVRNHTRFGVPSNFEVSTYEIEREVPSRPQAPAVEYKEHFHSGRPVHVKSIIEEKEKEIEQQQRKQPIVTQTQTHINIDNTGLTLEEASGGEREVSKSVVIKTPGPHILRVDENEESSGRVAGIPTPQEATIENPPKPLTIFTLSGKRPYHDQFDAKEQLNPPQLTNVINITNDQNGNPSGLTTIPQVQSPVLVPVTNFKNHHNSHEFPQIPHFQNSNRNTLTFRHPSVPPPNSNHFQLSNPPPISNVHQIHHLQSPNYGPTSELGQSFPSEQLTTTTTAGQSRPHYITEYHHHHAITQQILSRLRNSVRTSRATNLTMEDIQWLTALVDEANAAEKIKGKVATDDDVDETAAVDDDGVEFNQDEILEDDGVGRGTNSTNLLKGRPAGRSLKISEEEEEDLDGRVEEGVDVEMEKMDGGSQKGEFRAPKMIHRGFFPILPYSDQDPGPLLVNSRSLSLKNPHSAGRVSRELGDGDDGTNFPHKVSLTNPNSGLDSNASNDTISSKVGT